MAILRHAFSDELHRSLASEYDGFHDPEPGDRGVFVIGFGVNQR
jgi:hypothetical protein